jgi:hypothetical protein
MRAAWTVLATCLLLGLAACAPGGEDDTDVFRPDDGRTETDVRPDDAGVESTACSSSAECDDGVACTQDTCLAGRTCGHQALDALCADGDRCDPTTGCTASVCTTNEQCSDGVYCDGDESCIGGRCFDDPAGRDCNDGNVCTDDRCDPTEDRCVHDPIVMEGCDSDAGDGGAPFDPLVHYAGRFWFAPPQSSSCGAATYNIDTITFTRTDAELTVSGPPCTMVQAPPPTDGNFSVTCSQGACGTYTLAGSFSDSNNFTGSWSATFGGMCSSCSPQSADIVGVRR